MYLDGAEVRHLQRYVAQFFDRFGRSPYLVGQCNICGRQTVFFCGDKLLYRETLNCAECRSTSRYRSISRGILRALEELTSASAETLADLLASNRTLPLRMYDTQVPFCYETNAYPLPDMLAGVMEVAVSIYMPHEPFGAVLGPNMTNQNLEQLRFPDDHFDIVITSDVMEHVRLDVLAHQEIRRVLKPGGIYLFTVPHFRDRHDTLVRVSVVDPEDPSKDLYLTEREYHGDANSPEGGALSYRSYGTELDEFLAGLGFTVDYCKDDFPEWGIMNTELFYCRLSK